ncbi:MAG TPA: hypothetical protein VEL31_31870 [Ktedonobacteraceae bacterium]|nr:hypothetical protein [Ktedonobacteraceae bacterium]
MSTRSTPGMAREKLGGRLSRLLDFKNPQRRLRYLSVSHSRWGLWSIEQSIAFTEYRR